MNQEQTRKRLEEKQGLPFATIEDLNYVPKEIFKKVHQAYRRVLAM
jgi:hypothetical protein